MIALMYHDISNVWKDKYTISEDVFLTHMNLLKKINPSVLLTFDDGVISHYSRVFPILLRLKMKGIFFISTGFIEKEGYLGKKEIRNMYRKGMIFGTHGHYHKFLNRISYKEMEEEIVSSKKILEAILNAPIILFSFPGGRFSKTSVKLLKMSGYKYAFTSLRGINNAYTSPFLLKRFPITSNLSLKDMQNLFSCSAGFILKQKVIGWAKFALKKWCY